ncbi:hypothetical protein AAFF_G00327870 [Aldrovandia affinis]|uniref:Uncharacterized protein n=1 Tax=Aldrovandia affinis TaxID=143900 RepID=A0AAD7X2E5_9TELE|nr:hypothetical protein AAFF_G00327870 [Aldrovandia affinis]
MVECFKGMLEEWKVSRESLCAMTTDNGSNMKRAFQDSTNFSSVWLSCFGHNLNLAISKALKVPKVDSAIRACRHLVQGFNRSWKKKRELRHQQAKLALP